MKYLLTLIMLISLITALSQNNRIEYSKEEIRFKFDSLAYEILTKIKGDKWYKKNDINITISLYFFSSEWDEYAKNVKDGSNSLDSNTFSSFIKEYLKIFDSNEVYFIEFVKSREERRYNLGHGGRGFSVNFLKLNKKQVKKIKKNKARQKRKKCR